MATIGRLQDKVAIITGAASGIGRSMAHRFGEEGAHVVVLDVNSRGGEETAAHVCASGGSARFIETDVAQPEQVAQAVQTAATHFGGVDVLVNNAAIEVSKSIEETSLSDWQRVLEVNLGSIFHCARCVLPHLRRRGGGAILNIASDNGLLGIPHHAAYSAAKGGVISLTKQLAVDYGPEGIRVNCICPGEVATPMWRRPLTGRDAARGYQETGESYPLRRTGRPEEIANAALFLVSDEASWITGVILPVDGGYACR